MNHLSLTLLCFIQMVQVLFEIIVSYCGGRRSARQTGVSMGSI